MTRGPNVQRTHRFHLVVVLVAAVVPVVGPGCGTSGKAVRIRQPELPPPETGRLKVMSFNILTGRYDLHLGSWRRRRDLVVQTIRAAAPDLLAVQEVMDFQADHLRLRLPEYAFVSVLRYDGPESHAELGRHGECVAIFYRRDRFQEVDAGHLWFGDTPDEPGSRDWMQVVPRMASWVKLRTRGFESRTVTFFAAHLSPISRTARRRSAKLLRRRIGKVAGGGPVIVAGDFNDTPESDTYRILFGRGGEGPQLADAFEVLELDPEDGGTWHSRRGFVLPRRIDWIAHSPHLRTVSARINRHTHDGAYPSDHFPVEAVLAWRR